MDKVFKKILEGLEVFDMIYERHQNVGSGNSSQKEKLENDLKKEIKKLQRFREQVKNWQAANEIKDKEQLLEHRRLVEVAMEKYKVVEKGSKTKAYSDQSLAAADEEKIDNEAVVFVKQSLDTLQQQTESLEAEIERLQPLKKAKKNYQNEETRKELEELLKSHQWHTEKLEIVLRLLQNEIFNVEEVMNISEDITYYLEENRNPDFVFDDSIYDELDLEADQALINEIHVIPEDPTNLQSSTGNGTSNDASPVRENLPRSRSIHNNSSSNSRSNSTQVHVPTSASASVSASASTSASVSKQSSITPGIPPHSAPASSSPNLISSNSKADSVDVPPVIQSIGTSSNHQATVTMLKPAPVPALAAELKWSSLVKKKDPVTPTTTSATVPPSSATTIAVATSRSMSPTSSASGVNTNALNAATVLDALKKQKPKGSGETTPVLSSSPLTTSTASVNALAQQQQQQEQQEQQEKQEQQQQQSQQQQPQETNGQIPHLIAAEDQGQTQQNGSLQPLPTTMDGETIPVSGVSTTASMFLGFTKSQELAAATDGFRFLPPGIQSFILSISANKDEVSSRSVYNPFSSINHTPLKSYPMGLKAINLAESWNKVKMARNLVNALENVDANSLFFGFYYGRSIEERNIAFQILTQKGWKQEKMGSNWLLPKVIVTRGDTWNIGDYSVFNVDKWTTTERRNTRVEDVELL